MRGPAAKPDAGAPTRARAGRTRTAATDPAESTTPAKTAVSHTRVGGVVLRTRRRLIGWWFPAEPPRPWDTLPLMRSHPDEVAHRMGGHGAREEVPLSSVAADRDEVLVLVRGLDALADDVHAQRLRDGDDGPHDRGILRIAPHALHERAVDLQAREGKALQVGER